MSSANSPIISVVTSVYNCEQYIAETIDSIIAQSFTDWEFIIINDCSTDKSASIIQRYAEQDERIVFIDNKTNMGQCANLNHGYAIAKGKYIAHTDHDDISYFERLQRQYEYMEEHPDMLACGTLINTIYEDWHIVVPGPAWDYTPDELAFVEPFVNVLVHSTLMFNAKALREYGIEYGEWRHCEDYQIVLSCLAVGQVGCVPERLVGYRNFAENTTHTLGDEIIDAEVSRVRADYFRDIGVEGLDIFIQAARGQISTRKDIESIAGAMSIHAVNCGIVDNKSMAFKKKVVRDAFHLMLRRQSASPKLLLVYLRSSYRDIFWFFTRMGLGFLYHCLFKR